MLSKLRKISKFNRKLLDDTSPLMPVIPRNKNVTVLLLSTDGMIEREKKYSAHNYQSVPIVLTKAKGIYVWDLEGRRYFDYLSGSAANNFGHCHPKIVAALQHQATVNHHISRVFHSDTFGEYAEYVTKLFGYDKVLLMNTGVEAGDTACKISRKWGYRKKKIPNNQAKIIFARENLWGRSLTAVSASTDLKAFEGYGPFMPGFSCVPFNDLSALDTALRDPLVCAFMVEPIQGDAGIKVPSDGYLKGVRDLCSKHNVLWIADEIQSGMGRSGKRLAVDYEEVKPDIMVLGKSLGGGVYPVSACLANDPIMLVIEPGTHGSTFGGNPLASKVALTALQVLEEEKLTDNAYKMGEIFRKELRNRLNRNVAIEVRGKGLMNAIEVNKNYVDAWTICLKMKENGLVTKNTHDNIVRFAPPLIITEKELEESLDIIANTFDSFSDNLIHSYN